jgi:hypothetical protein
LASLPGTEAEEVGRKVSKSGFAAVREQCGGNYEMYSASSGLLAGVSGSGKLCAVLGFYCKLHHDACLPFAVLRDCVL